MKKIVNLPEEIWVSLSRDGLRRQPGEVLTDIDKALQSARIKDQNKTNYAINVGGKMPRNMYYYTT